MKKILILIGILALTACSNHTSRKRSFEELLPNSQGDIVKHKYYTLAYSEHHEGALWVFYRIAPEHLKGEAIRRNNFSIDSMIASGSASLSDYRGSGYDRGHLYPAADLKFDQEALDESFLLSNISPQNPSFNRGQWKKLEARVRQWAIAEGEIFVASGPVYKEIIDTIGMNEVLVPSHYYKVIYNNRDKMIAFILPNRKISKDLDNFVVTVDSVELLTGIDFFSKLTNRHENYFESSSDILDWE
ncbi:MAG: DNA/RNA non-specific endonuclease [Bacteroidales bacterium]|nr:DNA/RNA non-specific endonuclease [Bacteroidales bacterium]